MNSPAGEPTDGPSLTLHRHGRSGELRGRPTDVELGQAARVRRLADEFDDAASSADDDEGRLSWTRAAARLNLTANSIDGGDVVRIPLSPPQAHALARFMASMDGTSLAGHWRQGRTYVDLSEPHRHCDLVSLVKFHANDVLEALGWSDRDSPDADLLRQVRDAIVASQARARAQSRASRAPDTPEDTR